MANMIEQQPGDSSTNKVPTYKGENYRLMEEQYADPKVYDQLSDIPLDKGTFFFNPGHAKHDLGPYLIELVEEYGAVPYKVQTASRKGNHEIFVGMEPQELFRWVEKRMSVGDFRDVIMDKTQSLVDRLPQGWLKKRFDAMLAKRVEGTSLSSVLFAFRQQVEQVPTPDNYVNMIEMSIEQGNYEVARRNLAKLNNLLFNLNRQYAAAASFYARFFQFLEQPGVKRRMHTTERLELELEKSESAYEVAKRVILGSREWHSSAAKLKQQLDELDPPPIATPEETE